MADNIVVKIGIPSQKLQKAVRISLNDTVLALKIQMSDKIPDVKETLNYGFFLKDGEKSKTGKFLDEQKTLKSYDIVPTSFIDFCMKCRVGGDNDVKKQKKLLDDLLKGNLEKLQEKTTKTTEFNFWTDTAGTGTLV
jgi:N-terminal or F0 domain of Talin-head FERM